MRCHPHNVKLELKETSNMLEHYTSGWERFNYYASKIQRFGISRFDRQFYGYDDSTVLDPLREFPTFLLPNIRDCVLDFGQPIFHKNQLYRLCLGPTLASIEIKGISHEGGHFSDLCSNILIMSPKIQHLCMRFQNEEVIIHKADSPVFTLIRNLHDLRTFKLPTVQIPPFILAHLATQSSLKTLKRIRVPSSGVGDFSTIRFSSLKELSLVADYWSSSITIMNSMNCTFTAISVYCLDRSEPLSTIRDLLAILRPSFDSLSTIELKSWKLRYHSDLDVDIEVLDTIRPLLSCKQLRVVILKLAFLEALDDSWLLAAANAWPLLEQLRMEVRIPQNPKITFKGLVFLIRDLPRLQSIYLTLNLREADIVLLEGIPTGHIRCLKMTHPKLVQRRNLDSLLQAMFHQLKNRESSDKTTWWMDF
jgi:hypothetical protein